MVTQAASESVIRPRSARPLIYVVDDEVLIGEVVEQILCLEGFDVVLFSDPAAALKSFSEATHRPDLVVTDYVMRPINGMELLQKMRALQPGLRAVLYSGNVSAQILDLYANKPNAFLAKPFVPQNLVSTVQSVLEARP